MWKHWVGNPKSGPSDNHIIIKMKYTRNIKSNAKFQNPMSTPSGRKVTGLEIIKEHFYLPEECGYLCEE